MNSIDKLNGLSEKIAKRKYRRNGPNTIEQKNKGLLFLFLKQFLNPLIFLLIGCCALSFILGNPTDAMIIGGIVFLSGLISFIQEKGAIRSVESLLKRVSITATCERDSIVKEIPKEEIVIGDLIHIQAGDLVPADAHLIYTQHLFIDESILTGESIPQEKFGSFEFGKNGLKKESKLFCGTMVTSGFGKAIVTHTGKNTLYGHLVKKIHTKFSDTSFERKLKTLSYLLLDITLVLVLLVFLLNIYQKKPILDSFLFSLALSVGLVPQLLPAMIGVNLAYGAKKLSKESVIAKFLPSIENFGMMNVLCLDKTGTITTGKMSVATLLDLKNQYFQKANHLLYLNAFFQTAYKNPIDSAILNGFHFPTEGYVKVDEIPYDFQRKRITVTLKKDQQFITITKGAFNQVFPLCKKIEYEDGTSDSIEDVKDLIEKNFQEATKEGFKVLTLAYCDKQEENNLTFLGLIKLYDPIKPSAKEEIQRLKNQGIELKIITGDHQDVVKQLAKELAIQTDQIITGEEIKNLSDLAFLKKVQEKTLFAEIEPSQKEKIVLGLKKVGHTVGFLGDGINDVPAIFSSDVGISVDTASDAAKDVADIVLIEQDLTVLSDGIALGRASFGNTIKYLQMATSANLGNMLSMAIISLFLPFLPLLPKQVLLINFLSDFPEMGLATDHVDKDATVKPCFFNLKSIKHFMLVFGVISSIADFMTFFTLLYLKVDRKTFQTAWFIESVLSAVLIIFCLRTKKFFLSSSPSKLLLYMSLSILFLCSILPYFPFREYLGLYPISLKIYGLIFVIIVIYISLTEIAKFLFFKFGWNNEDQNLNGH